MTPPANPGSPEYSADLASESSQDKQESTRLLPSFAAGSTSMAAASRPPRGTEGRAAATSDKEAKSPWLGPRGVEGHSHSDRGQTPGLHFVRLPCFGDNRRLGDVLRCRKCSTPCSRRLASGSARPWGGGSPPPQPQWRTHMSPQWGVTSMRGIRCLGSCLQGPQFAPVLVPRRGFGRWGRLPAGSGRSRLTRATG